MECCKTRNENGCCKDLKKSEINKDKKSKISKKSQMEVKGGNFKWKEK